MPPDTARLTFREMTPGDLDDMAALLGDPGVMTYYPRPKTRQEAAQWIDWNQGPDNRPSQRVAEKIGLRPEKRALVHGGRDAVIYAAALGEAAGA